MNFCDLVDSTRRRRARADELAAAGKPLKLSRGEGRSLLVCRDTANMERWRITYFDELGPSGHVEYNNAADAFFDAIVQGN